MRKVCLLLAFGAMLVPGAARAGFAPLPFLYEADPYFSLTTGIGDASNYKRALNREIRVGKHQGVAFAFGYKYRTWRFELEAAYRASSVEGYMYVDREPFRPTLRLRQGAASGTIQDTALLFNAYYDFPTGRIWRPFVGGGMGVSHLALRDFQRPDTDTGHLRSSDWDLVLAYQLMAGLLFELHPATDLTIGYRYFGSENIDWQVHDPVRADRTETIKYTGTNVHLFEVGLHFRF